MRAPLLYRTASFEQGHNRIWRAGMGGRKHESEQESRTGTNLPNNTSWQAGGRRLQYKSLIGRKEPRGEEDSRVESVEWMKSVGRSDARRLLEASRARLGP
jgi:hypothetical protein